MPSTARFTVDKKALLHPARKYYGISMAGVPASVTTPITTISQETKKRPNLVMYYQDWGAGAAKGKPNFNTTDAENACAAGMLPMVTWESWNGLAYQPDPGRGVRPAGVLDVEDRRGPLRRLHQEDG